MCTSLGRYFSNAAFSGALTDVWPDTMAPNFVAANSFLEVEIVAMRIECQDSQGPYCATTGSMNSASTEYIMKSEVRDTKWPSRRTVMPDTPIRAIQVHPKGSVTRFKSKTEWVMMDEGSQKRQCYAPKEGAINVPT